MPVGKRRTIKKKLTEREYDIIERLTVENIDDINRTVNNELRFLINDKFKVNISGMINFGLRKIT